jgi:tellurite resistance protein TehA-like permease
MSTHISWSAIHPVHEASSRILVSVFRESKSILFNLFFYRLILCLSSSTSLTLKRKLTAVWLLPVVSPIVLAASGGVVAEILEPSQARLTLIVSYVLFGTGFPMAFMIMGLYYGRLAVYKIPP